MPSFFRRLILTGLVPVFVVGSGCGNNREEPEESDEVTRAAYLIDREQYSEAIFTLSERVRTKPGDSRARVMLASAYAARGGVHLSRYKNFAQEIMKWDQQEDDLLPIESGDPHLQTLATTAIRVHLVVRAFDSIPVLQSKEAYDDLDRAVKVLDEGGELKGGPSIYRALLRTANFKHRMMTQYRLQGVQFCQVELGELVRWLGLITSDLQAILVDVAGGTSDAGGKEHLLSIAEDLDLGLEELEKTLAPPKPGDKTSLQQKALINLPHALRKVHGSCD